MRGGCSSGVGARAWITHPADQLCDPGRCVMGISPITVTSPTTPTLTFRSDVQIRPRVRMAPRAVGLASVLCRNGLAPVQVDVLGHRLEMARIATGTDSAKVVDLKTIGYRADEHFICEPVRSDNFAAVTKRAVSGSWKQGTGPFPAPSVGVDGDLVPEPRQEARVSVARHQTNKPDPTASLSLIS